MSSVSSVGSGSAYGASLMNGMGGRSRPDPARMAEALFAKIDTKGQGYIEKSDLASAFAQIAGKDSSSASVDAVFGQLDGDGDGKVSQDEMSASLKKLADELDSQSGRMRMAGGGGMGGTEGMPPPPQPQNDAGFSKEELQSQLDEIGATDSQRSALIRAR